MVVGCLAWHLLVDRDCGGLGGGKSRCGGGVVSYCAWCVPVEFHEGYLSCSSEALIDISIVDTNKYTIGSTDHLTYSSHARDSHSVA